METIDGVVYISAEMNLDSGNPLLERSTGAYQLTSILQTFLLTYLWHLFRPFNLAAVFLGRLSVKVSKQV